MIKKKSFIFILFICLVCSAAYSAPQNIQATLQQLHEKYKNFHEGKNASYIPELAKVNPNYFGIVIVTVDGSIFAVGDADVPFAIESVSKPFAYGLALQDNGEDIVTKIVGLNATGQKFNSVMAIEQSPEHLQNPLVNAGAIQITSLIKGKTSEEKWQRELEFMRSFSDGKPFLSQTIYQSEAATNQHNRAIAELLASYNMMKGDPLDALDRYTKACSMMVTAKQLAMMGAVLANNGVHPRQHTVILLPKYVRDVLSEMIVNGLYENSGAWFWMVGLPAKSGVGGSILAIIPKKMAIVVFSPPLDDSGNSTRAQKVIKELSERWQLHLLWQSSLR